MVMLLLNHSLVLENGDLVAVPPIHAFLYVFYATVDLLLPAGPGEIFHNKLMPEERGSKHNIKKEKEQFDQIVKQHYKGTYINVILICQAPQTLVCNVINSLTNKQRNPWGEFNTFRQKCNFTRVK